MRLVMTLLPNNMSQEPQPPACRRDCVKAEDRPKGRDSLSGIFPDPDDFWFLAHLHYLAQAAETAEARHIYGAYLEQECRQMEAAGRIKRIPQGIGGVDKGGY